MRQGIIAAISTPPGKGGVAIIRISGAGAFLLVEGVFRPRSGRPISAYPARHAIYGLLCDGDEVIDDGILTLFPAGSSYTGEETAELSIHGGVLVTRTALELLFSHGAIPAAPGEFTRRAFLSGRLSLSEAEAIGDLLEAESAEQLRLLSSPSRARLRSEIESLRGELTSALGSLYARIDYPEEDLGEFTAEELIQKISTVRERLSHLISTYRTGRAINEGISTVLVGKPNVGKSTLFNLLLGEDAAIVTDIPGTTRDTLSGRVPLGRVLLSLSDTAGIRQGCADPIEKIGIERTVDKLRSAELIIALFDSSRPRDGEDEELLSLLSGSGGRKIALLTKSDIAAPCGIKQDSLSDFDAVIEISAKAAPGEAVERISDAVMRLFTDEKLSSSSDAIVASARQHAALVRALGFIDSALEAFALGVPADAASSDIELAVGAISELDGRAVAEDVVSDIFSRFCVGK